MGRKYVGRVHPFRKWIKGEGIDLDRVSLWIKKKHNVSYSVPYLGQVACGIRKPSYWLSEVLSKYSKRNITVEQFQTFKK